MLNGRGGMLRNAVTPFGKLFNRNAACLCYDTNETALKDAFSQHGDVIAVKVICHPTTGKSKGFGFVTFSSEDEATAAVQKMNGEVLHGRTIRVQYSDSGRSDTTDLDA
ncbi:glycine-rich RNA-binding protein blt801 [Setaria italica]|uniref:glycine-rich RNA-binding protein blt801 n=1 Tax=Setaria italica TaxID=4555 RepID=UPI000BE4C072|nr:glycine-rich RNA-binding protein blt801 [Setaria italica]